MMRKRNIILIIIMSILFILAIIGIYFWTRHDEELNITGKVMVSGNGYVIIESDNKDYLVNNVTNSYEIGDEITITYIESSLNDSTSPIEIAATNEKLITKAKENINSETNGETTNNEDQIDKNQNKTTQSPSSNNQTSTNTSQNNQNNKTNNTTNNNQNSTNHSSNNIVENNETKNNNSNTNNNTNIATKSADEAVLEYVNTVKHDADKGLTDTLKSGFITVVDFLFYDGTIAGHTFNELTTSAKLEVLKAALWIDDKIDHVFPGYKETISNGASKAYNSVKNLIVSTYLDITSSICESNASLCEQAKEDFQSLKTSFGLTWNFLKDLASSGLDKLKNWYEIWSGK